MKKFNKNKIIKISSAIISTTVFLATLTGCSGVSKSDYQDLENRVSALESKIDSSSSSSKTTDKDTKATENPSSSSNSKNSKATSSPTPKNSSKPSSSGNFDEESVSKQITVDDYNYLDADDNKFAFYVFDNKSNYNVDATIKLVTKDKNDNVLKEEEKTVYGLCKGKRSYASFALDPETENIVRTVTYENNTGKDLFGLTLTSKATKADGGANISIKNNGSTATKNLKYLTLFFNGDDLAGFDSGKVPDIQASSSEVVASAFYGDFDTAKVFILQEK